MSLKYQEDCNIIPWDRVAAILQSVGMSYTTPEIHKISFEASFAVIFVFDNNSLIGMGRILSVGVRQSAMYDFAIYPRYQARRIGQQILRRLLANTPVGNCILYSSSG